MGEPADRSFGRILGWLCILLGACYVGFGILSGISRWSLNAFDALLLGGIALVAGCVILYRRRSA